MLSRRVRLGGLAFAVSLAGLGAALADPSSAHPADLPAAVTCATDRPAVAYHPGGPVLADIPAIAPCESHLGFPSREPTLGISRANTLYFYPAGGAIPDPLMQGVGRSTDVGIASLDLNRSDATWTRTQLGPLPAFNHAVTTDPYFYLDPATDRLFATDLIAHCAQVATSDDGTNWNRSLLAGCSVADHQTVFAGKPVTSQPTGYQNVVYYCALTNIISTTSTTSACEKSTDGGNTFLPTANPAYDAGTAALLTHCGTGGAVGHGIVGPDGTVYLPKADVNDGSGHCRNQELAISHDEGDSWTHSIVNDKLGTATTPDAGVGVDAGIAVDSDGNIYYAWTAADRTLRLSVSGDQGRTWSDPQQISAPGLTETAFSSLAVLAPGKLAVAYVGSTNSPGAPFTGDYSQTSWNAYISVTDDALTVLPTYYAATLNDPADPLFRGQCCGQIQDFIDVKIDGNGRPWAAFIDSCETACAAGTNSSDDATEGYLGTISAQLGRL